MVVDFHGYTGSAHNQMQPNSAPWSDFALNNGIVMLWPDGLNDAPHGYRAWNCSSTDPNGPKGIDFTKFSSNFFYNRKIAQVFPVILIAIVTEIREKLFVTNRVQGLVIRGGHVIGLRVQMM